MPTEDTTTTPSGRDVNKLLPELEVPFSPDQVRWRVTNTTTDKRRGQIVPYADCRAYTDRLNALFTPQGWTREYKVETMTNITRAKKGESIVSGKVLVTCTVTILGIGSHSGTGEEWADDDNGMTSADAQAFKRACSCFGLGRYFYDSQGSFSEFDRSVMTLLRRGIQRDIARKIANPAVAVQTAGTIALAGSAAAAADIARLALNSASSTFGLRRHELIRFIKNIQPPLPRWGSTTVAFEKVLRDRVFGSIPITAPRRAEFEIILNACELRSGSAFRFGSRESGCWRYGVVDGNAVEVAHAVAASAAYPALLPALDEVIAFTDRSGVKRERRVLLTDGGVYDNLGVTCLEPGSAGEVGYNHFTPEYIICCDAGQGIFQDHPVPYLWGARMARAFESVFRKAQNATQNRLHLFAATDQINGFVLAYLGQMDDRVPCAPPDLVRREEVSEYPTDFGAMDAEDIDRLAKRGEQLARALVAHYCPEL